MLIEALVDGWFEIIFVQDLNPLKCNYVLDFDPLKCNDVLDFDPMKCELHCNRAVKHWLMVGVKGLCWWTLPCQQGLPLLGNEKAHFTLMS